MGELEIPSTRNFIATFLMGAVPKLVVLILSAIVAATISDMYTGATDAPSNICSAGSAGRLEPDENQRDRASRICFLGVATSVISVFTALTLIQMEMVILCAPGSLKRVGYGFGLLLSIIMMIFWIATSALLAYLYHHFCDNLANDAECNETDERFIATPVLGFICFVGWVAVAAITLIKLIKE